MQSETTHNAHITADILSENPNNFLQDYEWKNKKQPIYETRKLKPEQKTTKGDPKSILCKCSLL